MKKLKNVWEAEKGKTEQQNNIDCVYEYKRNT